MFISAAVAFLSLSCWGRCMPAARAQWAVIDVPAIAQLVQEVQTLQQQLADGPQSAATGSAGRCNP